jgi:GntR family transcriptional regulator
MRVPIPKYFLIRSILEARMERTFSVGDRLPSEAELGKEFEVSRITVQQALALMEQDGLVKRERGRGTFYLGASLRRQDVKPSQLLESLIKSQPDGNARVISTRVIPVSPLVALRLNLEKAAPVIAIERVGTIADQPILYINAYLPLDVGQKLLEDESLMTRYTLGELVSDRCGIVIGSVVQTIAATLADSTFAKHLGVEIGAPVLEGERTYYDEKGRPVVFSNAFYRADRHRFVVNVDVGEGQASAAGSMSSSNKRSVWRVA